MCMFPICFPWLSNTKTLLVFSLALLFPVKLNFLGDNGDSNGKWSFKKISYGPSANLRPLHNSNVVKVSIVKWTQILLFMDKSLVSGLVHCFWKCIKNGNNWQFWVCQKWNFQQWKSKSESTLRKILLPHYFYELVSDFH